MEEDVSFIQRKIQQMPTPRPIRFRWIVMLNRSFLFFVLLSAFFVYIWRGDFLRTAAVFFGEDAKAKIVGDSTWKSSKGHIHNGFYISYPYPSNVNTVVVEVSKNFYLRHMKDFDDKPIISIKYIKGLERYPNIAGEMGWVATFVVIPVVFFFLIAAIIYLINHYYMAKNGMPVLAIIKDWERGYRNINWKVIYKSKKNKTKLIRVPGSLKIRRNIGEKIILLLDPIGKKEPLVYDNTLLWRIIY